MHDFIILLILEFYFSYNSSNNDPISLLVIYFNIYNHKDDNIIFLIDVKYHCNLFYHILFILFIC